MQEQATYFGNQNRYRLFKAVKYLVYLLLGLNVYLFLQEDLGTVAVTFAEGIEPGELIQAFSATIDTAVWVILLLMFELETAVLKDASIRGWVKRGLHGLRGLCYIALVYALYGYWQEVATLYQVSPLAVADACSLLGGDYSVMVGLDDYLPLDAINCAALGAPVLTVADFNVLVDGETLRSAQILAWVDVINAADWLLVVLVLEVEVRLQLRGYLTDRVMNATKFLKLVIYAILFLCAAYWAYAGDFLDFYDAALWLFAFIFIELNVFEWQYETVSEHPVAA
ncbi:MAG: hypothetical protein ACRCVD_15205 [Halioglobus sp.]|jgi:hypothetical protein